MCCCYYRDKCFTLCSFDFYFCMKPTLLVLAAGMGSRYGGLKQLDGVGPRGETIMDYSVFDAVRAGFGKVVFVIRKHFREEFEQKVVSKYKSVIEVELVEQEMDKLPEGFDLDKTLSESGEVSRGICSVNEESFLITVEEHHKVKDVDGTITGVGMDGVEKVLDREAYASMNMWGFTPDLFEYGMGLFVDFLKENADEPKKEFYIPFVVNSTINGGVSSVKVLRSSDKWFGVTFKEDRPVVVEMLKRMGESGEYPMPLFG